MMPTPSSRRLVEQQFCAVQEKCRLGSMGKPVKFLLNGKPVFLCWSVAYWTPRCTRGRTATSLTAAHLEFGYQAVDFRSLRETGASWKVNTEETPEPTGINPNGRKKP